MVKNQSLKKGFTLIEVLLVIAIIAILAAIVIIAINPARQIAQSNNAQRRSNVNAIVNAISQYQVDNRGTLPATITTTITDICQTGVSSTSCIDLSVLTLNQTYIGSMPTDPTSSPTPFSGYDVSKNANGRVTVSAPAAENSETISVTR
ncbi:MAG: prepilin-type N-terminal cleavage/methylation domain-containing protein [Patescibacteria group bacterium]